MAGNIKSGVSIAGTTGDYPSATYPLPSASNAIDDLNSATFEAKMKSSATFEYWTSEGVHQTNTGDADITADNIKYVTTIFGTTGTYEGPPLGPTNFVSTEISTNQIDHSWDAMTAATSYILIVNEGSPVTFVPTDGVSYSPGSQTGGDIIYAGSGTTYSHKSGVVTNSRYYYTLYSYDGTDYSIVGTTSAVSTLDCSDTTYGRLGKGAG